MSTLHKDNCKNEGYISEYLNLQLCNYAIQIL